MLMEYFAFQSPLCIAMSHLLGYKLKIVKDDSYHSMRQLQCIDAGVYNDLCPEELKFPANCA